MIRSSHALMAALDSLKFFLSAQRCLLSIQLASLNLDLFKAPLIFGSQETASMSFIVII